MVTSSVNAPLKKGGAGGAYTWGGAMDVTDYSPIGLGGSANKVMVMQMQPSVPVAMPMTQPQPMAVSISDSQQFPALGASVVAPPPAAVAWGPPQVAVSSQPRVVLTEDSLRTGSTQLFDAQHPRNAFARKPRTSAGYSMELAQPVAIDWSASGTVGLQQQVIQQLANNPAHLGPYAQQPAPAPQPMSVLKAMQPTYTMVQPKLTKTVMNQPQHFRPKITQPRGR